MEKTQTQDVRVIRMVYGAMMSGVMFFLICGFLIILKIGPLFDGDKILEQVFLIVSTLFAVIGIPSSILIFRKRINGIENLNFTEKISIYRSAIILRASILEGLGFFFIVCFMQTGTKMLAVEVLLIIALMAVYFPTDARISEEMKLDSRDIERIQGK